MADRDQRLEADALVLWKKRMYEVVGYEKPVSSLAARHGGKLWAVDIYSEKMVPISGVEITQVALHRASRYTELFDVDRLEADKKASA